MCIVSAVRITDYGGVGQGKGWGSVLKGGVRDGSREGRSHPSGDT
jgi:hypothetical protein